jgi:hypothetical protein
MTRSDSPASFGELPQRDSRGSIEPSLRLLAYTDLLSLGGSIRARKVRVSGRWRN